MNDEKILAYSVSELLDSDRLLQIYDEEDCAERERLKACFIARAKELNMEKEVRAVLKAYDTADKKLAEEYTRQNASDKSKLPLSFDGKGNPVNTIDNFLIILRGDPFFKGLKFNILTNSPETEKDGITRRWDDTDDSRTRSYIERKYHIHNQPKLEDALRIVFHEHEYHPVKQIIESVQWDGESRIEKFLCTWLRCEDGKYTREVSRLIFAGGINRLYNPGCKFDDVPVLIGTKQGEGKSTIVRWLALNDCFFTELTEIDGQKGVEAIEGAWICEIAELLAVTKAKEVEAVKAYITKQADRYRKPFERRVKEYPRQCVFIGTTNREQFLTDKTGNRRFYPVKVHQSGYDLFNNEKEIKEYIFQCWAEAKAKYDKGEMLPFADKRLLKEIKKYQNEAVEDDWREGLITAYLEDKYKVCILELWQKALGNEFSKPTRKDSNDIVLILQKLGEWKRSETPERLPPYGLQKVWQRIRALPNNTLDDIPF